MLLYYYSVKICDKIILLTELNRRQDLQNLLFNGTNVSSIVSQFCFFIFRKLFGLKNFNKLICCYILFQKPRNVFENAYVLNTNHTIRSDSIFFHCSKIDNLDKFYLYKTFCFVSKLYPVQVYIIACYVFQLNLK